MDIEHDPATTR